MTDGRPRPQRARRARAALSGVAALAALVALVVIWAVRLGIEGTAYVSELGSPPLPTAPAFNAALLLLAGGGVLAGIAASGAPRAPKLLGFWTVSASLVTAGASFAFASRVTCTPGCPVPFTPASTPQDLVHVVAAVLGFGAATWAMLQVAAAGETRATRIVSRVCAVLVGLVASVGGVLSVLRVRTDIGGNLEFIAMSVAVLWLVVYAAVGAASVLIRVPDTGPKHASASIASGPREAPGG